MFRVCIQGNANVLTISFTGTSCNQPLTPLPSGGRIIRIKSLYQNVWYSLAVSVYLLARNDFILGTTQARIQGVSAGARPPLKRSFTIQNTLFGSIQAPVHHCGALPWEKSCIRPCHLITKERWRSQNRRSLYTIRDCGGNTGFDWLCIIIRNTK